MSIIESILRKHESDIKVFDSWVTDILMDRGMDINDEFKCFVDFLNNRFNSTFGESDVAKTISQYIIINPVVERILNISENKDKNITTLKLDGIIKGLFSRILEEDKKNIEVIHKKIFIEIDKIETVYEKQSLIIGITENVIRITDFNSSRKLGIVFTPMEVVDFIVHSVDDVLKNILESH